MSTLSDLVSEQCDLDLRAVEWLHLLTGDWQLVSDLSFADLVLWVPLRDGSGHLAVAHCRPSTAATVHHSDPVGTPVRRVEQPHVDTALSDGTLLPGAERDGLWRQAVPVRHAGRVIAVLARHAHVASVAAREPARGRLSAGGRRSHADGVARRLSRLRRADGRRRGAPRVGDGLVHLDADGRVLFASPNALSNYHRLGLTGDLEGELLAEVTAGLLDGPDGIGSVGTVDETLPLVVTGRAPWRTEVQSRGVALSLRAIPLVVAGERIGALVLCRDVSELHRRERELMTKDATIREIHHRVKNNLQTVSALLRLQARRIESPEAREALGEAMRRVATIALVHETLAHGINEAVDFDALLERGLALTADLLAVPVPGGRAVRRGSFGVVHAQDANALALVLVELVSNAVEHGREGEPATVIVEASREGPLLEVAVIDDGPGLPEGFAPGRQGLGTQIVQALVAGELSGSIDWTSNPGGGTRVVLRARLQEGGAA